MWLDGVYNKIVIFWCQNQKKKYLLGTTRLLIFLIEFNCQKLEIEQIEFY